MGEQRIKMNFEFDKFEIFWGFSDTRDSFEEKNNSFSTRTKADYYVNTCAWVRMLTVLTVAKRTVPNSSDSDQMSPSTKVAPCSLARWNNVVHEKNGK